MKAFKANTAFWKKCHEFESKFMNWKGKVTDFIIHVYTKFKRDRIKALIVNMIHMGLKMAINGKFLTQSFLSISRLTNRRLVIFTQISMSEQCQEVVCMTWPILLSHDKNGQYIIILNVILAIPNCKFTWYCQCKKVDCFL